MSNFELMGKNLIALRKRKGITQTQLANLVNETSYRPDIKQSRISDLERLNGEELPSIPLLAALSEVLETNPGYILGLTENDRPSKGWDNEIPLSVQSEEELAHRESCGVRLACSCL
jgi:transcriptional regulator with XRE-family HTH domain